MRRIAFVCAVVAAAALPSATAATRFTSSAVESSLACSGAVSWQKAGSLVGHVATVQGRVAGTHYAAASNGSPTFLNVGVDYPNPGRFVVLIWIENRSAFGRPEVRYRGRTICARGLISRYQGVPEIVARSPSQIKFIR